MEIFGSEFNPLSDTEMPENFTVYGASFMKGSPKLEGKNPYTLFITASGNMFAAVAYQADMAGLSEEEKQNQFNDYTELGFCEFTGTDGRVVTIKQTKSHDGNNENGACNIEIAFDVPAAKIEKYTDLIRDNYNMSALVFVSEYLETDFSECSIEVNLQTNETIVSVQYYIDEVETVRQRIDENPQNEWGEWHGLQSANIQYGLIKNTLVFDNSGNAVLVLQTSRERNIALSEYAEPEFSFAKLGFSENGTCVVYEEHYPHFISAAIQREEWGSLPDDWNIELSDYDVNGYSLIMWYHMKEEKYRINIEKDGIGCSYDYYAGEDRIASPDLDTVRQTINNVFGTKGDDFYKKPIAYFKQFVQQHFGMSMLELYALPKQ